MRNTYPWAALVERGRAQPNVWLRPPLRNVPYRVLKRVRLRQHPDLRLDDGRVEAKAEHRYTDENGTERADIWLRFVPSTPRGRMEPTRQPSRRHEETTMSIPQRKVDALPDLHARAKDAAWEKRTTISALINEGLASYVDSAGYRSRLSNVKDTPGTDIRLTFRVEDELWDAATERAAAEGDSLASVVRRILQQAADEVATYA